jgi:hypothetical protein
LVVGRACFGAPEIVALGAIAPLFGLPLDLGAKSAGRHTPFLSEDFGVWLRNCLIQWTPLLAVKEAFRGAL